MRLQTRKVSAVENVDLGGRTVDFLPVTLLLPANSSHAAMYFGVVCKLKS